jgi:hypothetical protein
MSAGVGVCPSQAPSGQWRGRPSASCISNRAAATPRARLSIIKALGCDWSRAGRRIGPLGPMGAARASAGLEVEYPASRCHCPVGCVRGHLSYPVGTFRRGFCRLVIGGTFRRQNTKFHGGCSAVQCLASRTAGVRGNESGSCTRTTGRLSDVSECRACRRFRYRPRTPPPAALRCSVSSSLL